jgi:D-aminopeptidase
MVLRARDLGIRFEGTPGPHNAITDVPGVTVGYVTTIDPPVCTGVTAILPRGRDGVGKPCAAARFSLNGNGEMTGSAWLDEVGELTLPITISNTHAIGACHTGVIEWVNKTRPGLAQWLLPVCAETWDGYLNDINGGHVTPAMVHRALDAAHGGPIAEGSVGGGTGMNCYEFKGGTGTASRRIEYGDAVYTVGVLLQANFGSRPELTVNGVPAGRLLDVENPLGDWPVPAGAGSCIAVVATDAPLSPAQCAGLARRVPLGLARTGTTGSLFSGDIFLAFSTADSGTSQTGFPVGPPELVTTTLLPWNRIDAFYAATVYAVEEAVLNAMVVNETVVGRDGHRSPALPHDQLRDLLGVPRPG